MRCLGFRVMAKAMVLSVFGLLSLPPASYADSLCDSPEVREHLPPLPRGCHAERITAAGEISYGIVRSADYLAREAWKRLVIEKYGERFQRWHLAACQKVECVPGSLAGTKRCTYSGFPCSPDVDVNDIAKLSEDRGTPGGDERFEKERERRRDQRALDESEIKEMQLLLGRAGFKTSIDGEFGEQTSESLIKWQRKLGFPDDGLATFENLERLRHATS
jgi:Putative peptidoglycan binding domain